MMKDRKTILVTGGTGYIGSHTAVELIQNGFDVVIIDNLSNSKEEVVDAIARITGIKPIFACIDLNDRTATLEFLKAHPVDAIIHFAAFKAVGESVEKPLAYYRNNLVSLINLLEICRELAIRRFVFSSSCSVYGDPDKLPIKESTPLKPARSPYANTKKIGEDILRDAAHTGDLHVIALRYFNPVGAHPSHLIGENPAGAPLNLFPVITQTAAGLRKKLQVYGTDYTTKDGSAVRDYIHVVDVALAHVAALERLLNTGVDNPFEVFNIGTGSGLSVLEVIRAFEEATGIALPYECVARREGDVEQVYADTALAAGELGWKARHGLGEMIRSAWAWEPVLKEREGRQT